MGRESQRGARVIRILISAEGSNELGTRCDPEEGDRFPSAGPHPGVIEKLAEKVSPGGWEVRHAIQWKGVHKLRVGNSGIARGEAANVERLALRARELGCNSLVFLRDRDGSSIREKVIKKEVDKQQSGKLRIAGGVPVEMLESWLLALKGVRASERVEDPAKLLEEEHDVKKKRTTDMVQLVMNSRIDRIPEDAVSLLRWLRSLATALNVKIPKQWPRPKAG